MPTSLGVAQGSIVISTASLSAAEARARSAGRNITQSLSGIGTGAAKAQTGITGLAGSIGGLAAGYLSLRTVTSAFDLGSLAATNERTRLSFDKLAAGVGESGDAMLSAMQKGSRGAIANSELILNANRAILLGAADSSEEMVKLLEVARVRGQALGLSTGEAFTRLAQGIGKLEIEILDELGLAVKLIPTYNAFAAAIGKTAAELTEAEKRQALFNEIVAKSQGLIDGAAGSSDDVAASFERFGASLANAKQAIGEILLDIGLTDTIDAFTLAFTDSADQVERFVGWLTKLQGALSFTPDAALSAHLKALNRDLTSVQDAIARFGIAIGTRAPATISGPMQSPYQAGLANNAAITATAPGVGGRTDAQVGLIKDWAASVQSIEQDANSARLDATQSYESQRSETIRSYEQGIARDAQDFAIGRARAAKQLADTIAEIGSDAAKREADWQADLNASVAQITSEGNSRVADLERDYQKSRERAEADHRETLFSAAARLDAVAVANEQRAFAKSSREAEVDYRERLSSEQANIQERIAQENDAHRVRLEDAREADRQRIQDATEALADAQRLEDEDRALSAARRAEDHAAQLQQMAVAQGERMAQIARHAAEERAQMDEEFKAALAKEELQDKEFMLRQIELKRQSLLLFDSWFAHINKAFAASVLGPLTKAESAAAAPAGVDPGWFSGFDQPIPKTTRSGAGTASRTNVLNIASGAIIVNAAPGMSPELIADVVNSRLLQHYRELAN